ncbi:Uncharacterised protein [Mycobacteroides abscessus subsp. abscessus]|nr:Uncharacterised protein [Mycobacteroides abscessus subsp. abscessus]
MAGPQRGAAFGVRAVSTGRSAPAVSTQTGRAVRSTYATRSAGCSGSIGT